MADKIIQHIQEGTLDPGNALDIIKHVSKLVRGDKDAAVDIIETIAAGRDTVLGTADDCIPPDTVKLLKLLLESDMVSQLAQELYTKKCSCFC